MMHSNSKERTMTKLTTERLEKLQDNLLQFQDSYSDPADKDNYDIFVDALHMLDEFKAAKEKLLAYEQAAKKPIGSFHISGGQVEATTDYCRDGEWPVQDGEVLVYAAPVLPKQPELLSIGELLHRLEEQTGEKWVEESAQPVPMEFDAAWENTGHLFVDNKQYAALFYGLGYKTALAPTKSEIPFGDVEPIEVTDNMVYAFHNQLSDSALGSDEFTDIKHGLCAALMNIPHPAQPVIPEMTYVEAIKRGIKTSNRAQWIIGYNAAIGDGLSAQPVSEPYKLEIDMDDADHFSITHLHEIIYGKKLIWPEAKLLARFMLDVKQRASAAPARESE